jgi:mannonate dehydratase
LKITDVRVVVTNPERSPMGNFVLVKIVTSEDGLYGWGDATCTGSELAVAKFIEEYMRPVLIGRDPMRLEDIWQTLFHHPYYRSGSVHMSALSGVDMALWDIKGKVAGLPVYELLGGRARTKLLTYTSVSGRDFREVEEGARRMIERGYKVLKVQVRAPGLESGYAVPPSERQRAATEKAHQAGVPPVETWEPDRLRAD